MRVTVELVAGPHDGRLLLRGAALLKDGGSGMPRWLHYRGARPLVAGGPAVPEKVPTRYELRACDRAVVGAAIAAGDSSCRVRYDYAPER